MSLSKTFLIIYLHLPLKHIFHSFTPLVMSLFKANPIPQKYTCVLSKVKPPQSRFRLLQTIAQVISVRAFAGAVMVYRAFAKPVIIPNVST